MSNIFTDLPEVKEMRTEEPKDFNTLLNIKLAAELTKYHGPIFAAIMEDPNEDLKQTLKEEIHGDQRISLESNDSEKLLRANILDNENKRIFFIDMTTKEEEGIEKITQATYDTLSEYVQDPILVMQNVKDELKDNAI